jgi:hypothetical protein
VSNDSPVSNDQAPDAPEASKEILVATIDIYDVDNGENINVLGKLADPTCLERPATPALLLATFLATNMELVAEMARAWSHQIARPPPEEACPTHDAAPEVQ